MAASPTIYVCLDTNILVRIISQGKPGCERELWNELKDMVVAKTVRLLVPEVILLELNRQWRIWPQQLATHFAKIETALEKQIRGEITFSEVKDVGVSLRQHLAERKVQKEKAAEENYRDVSAFLATREVSRHDLSNDILLQGQRRHLSGGLSDPEKRGLADCFIVESLIAFFSTRKGEKPELLMCSENVGDFGIDLGNGKIGLHPIIREGLPPAELFVDLKSLVSFLRERKVVEEPTPQEVDKALQRENSKQVAEAVKRDEMWKSIWRQWTQQATDADPLAWSHSDQTASNIDSLVKLLKDRYVGRMTIDNREQLRSLFWREFHNDAELRQALLSALPGLRELAEKAARLPEPDPRSQGASE